MKRYELKDRVIVLTGATGGLGLAAARALRAKGAKLALFDLDQAAVDKMAADLGGAQVAAGWVANVRSMESLTAAMQAAAKRFGGIDVVIAGADIARHAVEVARVHAFQRAAAVWDRHKGIWKYVALEEVVGALVDCIEYRRETVTVPRSNSFAAIAPDLPAK